MPSLPRHTRPMAGAAAIAAAAASLPLLIGGSAADAATPCGNTVTSLSLASKSSFVNRGKVERYNATVDYPGKSGFYDQSSRVMVGKYPAGSVPTLLNMPLGDRATIHSQLTSQQPNAIAAINGDFFIYRTIAGKDVEFPRGPMIKSGQIVRADRQKLNVVGVDSTGAPFGGSVGVSGTIRIGKGPKTRIAGINWDSVQDDGATLFTRDYSTSSASPRPPGAGEWVLDQNSRITEIRTSTVNAARRGLAVQPNTQVLAFPPALESVAAAGAVGKKVRVRTSQSTDSGVALQTAIGRGVVLVRRGIAAPAGCEAYDHSAAARPRTIVGWTRKGAWRSLTIPGDKISGTSRTKGFGLANSAALAKEFGLRYAYELDGGASTTWYTKSKAGAWTRQDLWGVTGGSYERPVTNGLAFLPPPAQ